MEEDELKKDLNYLIENMRKINELWTLEDTKINPRNIFKRLVRKLTWWLYKPMFVQQMDFNMYVAAAISDICRMQSREVAFVEEGLSLKPLGEILPKSDKPRIVQFVSSLNYGDAVGNEVFAYKKVLEKAGYVTQVFAGDIHKKIPAGMAYPIRFMPELTEKDIVIYHFSSQCGLFEEARKTKAKIILRYHNITPPSFFHGYDENAEKATSIGLRQVKELKAHVSFCLPVSEFNRQDLVRMGYECNMQVLPILIRFADYEQKPSKEPLEKYRDGITNILFVGRMAPNKKVEDVITAFAHYKKSYNADARLFLVGSFQEGEKYYKMLCRHIAALGVKDVIFPGHIPFSDVLAYYRLADAFVCLSEHEGFCVPLVEAMYFHVPIVAYSCCAVPDTMGGKLSILGSKDPDLVAQEINRCIKDQEYRKKRISRQDERLADFDNKEIEDSLLRICWEIAGI